MATQRERTTAVIAHLSWFFLPIVVPIAVWALGRWIGSTTLRVHGAAAANAHLTPVLLFGFAAIGAAVQSAVEGDALLVVDLFGAVALFANVLAVVVLIGRSIGAVLAAFAAERGELRAYNVSVRLFR